LVYFSVLVQILTRCLLPISNHLHHQLLPLPLTP
jgi:hypothetical protein